jgi:hypothetical protein
VTVQRSQGAPRAQVAARDEQPYVPAGAAAPLVARDAGGRVRDADAARALARRPRRKTYLPRAIVCAEGFEPHNRRRVEWTRERMRELVDLTGEVSRGVGAMLVAAGWLYAGGEWAAENAATKGDVEGFRTAATLTTAARTHELGAWELAVREADARKKRPSAARAPWLAPKETP